jgi:hypothetical protein
MIVMSYVSKQTSTKKLPPKTKSGLPRPGSNKKSRHAHMNMATFSLYDVTKAFHSLGQVEDIRRSGHLHPECRCHSNPPTNASLDVRVGMRRMPGTGAGKGTGCSGDAVFCYLP